MPAVHAYVESSNDNVDKMLKRFKKAVKNSNIMMEIFERQQYDKPSRIKRGKKLKSIARNKYRVLKEKQDNMI